MGMHDIMTSRSAVQRKTSVQQYNTGQFEGDEDVACYVHTAVEKCKDRWQVALHSNTDAHPEKRFD